MMNRHLFLITAVSLAFVSCDKVKETMVERLKEEVDKADMAPIPPYRGEIVTQLSEESFDAFSTQRGRVIVIDFYADSCVPCRQLSPILDAVAEEHKGRILIGKVNVEQAKPLAVKMGVSDIPDVRIYKNGKEVDRFVGLPAEETVRQRLEQQLVGLPPILEEPEPIAVPDQPKEPTTKPMTKDWLPPGVERRQ